MQWYEREDIKWSISITKKLNKVIYLLVNLKNDFVMMSPAKGISPADDAYDIGWGFESAWYTPFRYSYFES